jgi:nitrite reductase/ring-hydroxylating ferredoxin subunit
LTDIRVKVGPLSALDGGVVVAIPLARGADNRPREALVLRGSDGVVRAYLNLCRHLPVPIDGGSRSYLTRDGKHLLCGTHGALFRRDDGMCVAGPCLHLRLFALTLAEDAGELFVIDHG